MNNKQPFDTFFQNYMKSVQRNTTMEQLTKNLNLEQTKDKKYITSINCDILNYDFNNLLNMFGLFDVIIVDPPWNLSTSTTRGVTLKYEKLNDKQIMSIPIEILSKNGLIFLWTLNCKLSVSLQLLKKWEYKYDLFTYWKLHNNNIFAYVVTCNK